MSVNDGTFYDGDITTKRYAFQKLTPTENADLTVYEDALDFVFEKQNNDIRNIAITGVYGSGKSSVVNSYERAHNKRFIHISLTHFEEVSDEDSEEVLEKKIVNQLVQQVPQKLIPDTKFKTKGEFSLWSTGTYVFGILMLFVFAIYFYSYTNFVNAVAVGRFQQFQWFATDNVLLGVIISFIIVSILLGIAFIRWQTRNHIINKIAINGNEMEFADSRDDKSYFNRHIDEILYVLEKITITPRKKGGFDGIVIEDLDRFDDNVDSKIFEKLRELCMLGNNRIYRNPEKAYQPLRFLYLLSDNTFLSKERTKFFDYIIPIIPVVDSSNSYAKIKECIQDTGYDKELDDRFLHGLSLYFDDYRLLKNIINEFQIYAGKLSKTEHNYNILLAMIVYKNFFPKDFADLQLREGFVYNVFEKKASLVENEKKQLNNDITAYKNRLVALNQEKLANENELQAVKNDRKISMNSYKYQDKQYWEWEQNDFPKRLQAIRDKVAHKDGELREKIVKLQLELIHINNKKLCDLITNENVDEVLEVNSTKASASQLEIIQNDKYFDIMKYLIRSGYLDDLSYRDYMACFDENGMSVEDKNFLIGVNNREGKKFDYKLDNNQLVYENLVSDDFLLPAIRNYNLIDFIIRRQKRESLASFVLQLKENMDVEFIGQYLRNTTEYNDFIKEICQLWEDFIDVILSDDNREMTLEEIQTAILTALVVCSEDVINKQNKSELLTQYLSENICEIVCEDNNSSKIAKQMYLLNVKLHDLDSQISTRSLREELICNNVYSINFDNLYSILVNDMECSQEEVQSKFLTLLLSGKNQSVTKYVEDNISKVVAIISENMERQFDLPEIVVMVSTSEISEDIIAGYLKISDTVIDNISDIDSKYWDILAERHTFKEMAENVLQFFEKKGINGSLVQYLNNSKIGENIDFSSDEERSKKFWMDAYSRNEFSDEAYISIVENIGSKIDDFSSPEIGENKCHILLQNNMIAMNVDSLNNFRNNYPALLHEFICSDVTGYISLVSQKQIYSLDEVINLLEEDTISDEKKIELLDMTNNTISVKDKIFSDELFNNIITKHLDVNDLRFLVKKYDSYNECCKNEIYKMFCMHVLQMLKLVNYCSEELLLRYFSDSDITLVDKADVLGELLNNKEENTVLIADLLIAAKENMLARLFGQERSRMSSVNNDDGHWRLLEVLKDNNIISDFVKEDDGKKLKIKRS